MIQQLERGTLDLAFLALETLPEGVHGQVLYQERYQLVARKNHPALQRKLSVKSFSKLNFVIVSPDGGGFHGATDLALEKIGLKRSVVLSVPHFLIVPEVIARTDLVAMLPSRVSGAARMARGPQPEAPEAAMASKIMPTTSAGRASGII